MKKNAIFLTAVPLMLMHKNETGIPPGAGRGPTAGKD
jgi:hypothetical protein